MDSPDLELLRPETPEVLRYAVALFGQKYSVSALRRWRTVAHSIILWLRLYQYHSSQVREILRFFSDTDLMTDAIEEDSVEDLLFSVQQFRPNKQAKVNPYTIDIMRQDPKERRPQDVRPIEAGLRGYAAFRQYPPHILRQIAEKAWFQEFDKHSVIVREGDYPLYYYFIIYGSAIVTIIDKDKMLARTVAVLNRGDSFGELAIMNKAKRASTVIAREKCGLMMLEDKDYLEIFMQGGVKFLDTEFVSGHVLFDGFDTRVLKANPHLVKLNFFNPGVVIVEDSRISFWIFLVISGKAAVKMAVHSSVLRRQGTEVVPQEQLQRQELLAEYRAGRIGHRTLLRRNWRRHLAQREKLAATSLEANLELRQLGLARAEAPARQLSRIGREDTLLLANERSFPPLAKAYFTSPSQTQAADVEANQQQQQQQQPPPPQQQQQQQQPKKQQQEKVQYISGRDQVVGKRTLATDLNREYYEQLQGKLWTGEIEDESEYEYMPVQVLERGSVFGFADHFFENQPPQRLESLGCEMLCIRRELYFDNVNEITLFNLGNTLRPFPAETAVLAKNREVKEWAADRRTRYAETLHDMAAAAVDVHDARSRFPKLSG